MSDTEPIECPELHGKCVQTFKIHSDPRDGTEIHIEFEDGTAFSCSVTPRQKADASLVVCGGPGEPEILHRYDLG